jgi:uncharacterized protein YrrD
MERTALFQKNANVLSASGQQLGSLQRVVLHPETKVITDIVVQGGGLFHKEYRVIPIDQIAETNEDQIQLHANSGEWESFLLFEERRIVNDDETPLRPSTDSHQVIYGVPGVGPAVVSGSGEQFTTQIEQNIPEGTVALKEGAKVYSADDKHVGNVERVLVDPSADRASHLIVTYGLLAQEKKLIPMSWVMMLGEEKVHLNVTEAQLKELDSTPPVD